jgi:Tol biopolymer transport system component
VLAIISGVVIIGSVTAMLWTRSVRSVGPPPIRVVPLTTLHGLARWPAFSPDGSQVAFFWDSETADNLGDIYVTLVGSAEVRRLTWDPAAAFAPSWSPDGRQIAFLSNRPKDRPQAWRIYLVSPLGGPDLKVSDLLVTPAITWTPDSRSLVAGGSDRGGSKETGLYRIPVDGGTPSLITQTKAPEFDGSPAFSPDGRELAYVKCIGWAWGGCDVYILDVDTTFSAVGPARRVTTQLVNWITNVAWSRDGQDLIYNQLTGGVTSYLWRIRANGSSPPQRIEAAGLGATYPATAPSRDRLVFSRERIDEDIYSAAVGKTPQPLLTSSFADHEPQFSPDGHRIAFSSARSGEIPEIWLAASDGTGPHQLTNGPGHNQGEPHWSPNGKSIVFESLFDDGHWHIYAIDADGGPARRLTMQMGDQNAPSWSRDGQWIYFSADDGHGRDIWRMPASGGPGQRVTNQGSGYMGRESADGKSILYKPDDSDAALLAVPVTGGPQRQMVPCVRRGEAFTIGTQGVYYVACAPGPNLSVHLLNVGTGRDTVVWTLEDMASRSPSRGLLKSERDFSVSPDGGTVLYTRIVEATSDLMLIENYR